MQETFEPSFLTKNSVYRVTSLGSKDEWLVSTGTFLGYTIIGEGVTAMNLRLDKSHKKLENNIRLIPTHMIMCIDIIEHAEDEEDISGEDEDTSRSYQ